MGFFRNKPAVPKNDGWKTMNLYPLPYRATQQDTQDWVWPTQTTQYGARMTEFWWGNQLPSSSTRIPGVPDWLWAHPRITNTQNTNVILTGGSYPRGISLAQANTLMTNAQNAWTNRYGDL